MLWKWRPIPAGGRGLNAGRVIADSGQAGAGGFKRTPASFFARVGLRKLSPTYKSQFVTVVGYRPLCVPSGRFVIVAFVKRRCITEQRLRVGRRQ